MDRVMVRLLPNAQIPGIVLDQNNSPIGGAELNRLSAPSPITLQATG